MRHHFVPFALLALAAIAPAQSSPQIVKTQSVTFLVAGKSIWNNGTGLPEVDAFLGLDLANKTVKIGGISSGIGLELDGNFSAKLGLESYFSATGGTFTANYKGALQYRYDSHIQKGATFPVQLKFTANTGSSLITTSPAYNAGMKGVANFSGSLVGKAAFAYQESDKTLASGSSNNTKTLFDLQDLADSKLTDLAGILTPLGVTLQRPVVYTSGHGNSIGHLVSNGYDPFITFETTLAAIIGAFLGDAGEFLQVLDGENKWSIPELISMDVSWDICKLYVNCSFGMRHDFDFAPHATVFLDQYNTETGALIASKQVTLDTNGNGTVNLQMPPTGGIVLKSRVVVSPSFNNKLSMAVGGGAGFVPLSIHAKGSVGLGDWQKSFDDGWDSPRYDWDFGSALIATLANQNFSASDPISTNLNDLAINPYDPAAVPDNVYPSTSRDNVEAQVPLYNGYAAFGDDPANYELKVYCDQGMGFGDLGGHPAFFAQFDGMSSSDVQKYTNGAPLNATWHQDHLDVSIPARLLKPGLHSVKLGLETQWAGVYHYVNYDVPVTVATPAPAVDGALNTRFDFEGTTIHRADGNVDTLGYLHSRNAFLETEVVLDDGTVLPSEKYLDGKFIPNGVYRDIDYTTSSNDTKFFFSGNDVVAFTIPASLASQYAGTKHSILLRTRDFKTNGFVTSTPSTATDIYFVVPAPTISQVVFTDLKDRFPVSGAPFTMVVQGSNFTPATVVQLDGVTMPTTFAGSGKIAVLLSLDYLDALHKAGKSSVDVAVLTPRYENIPGADATHPSSSGGTAHRSIRFDPLTPVVTEVAPSQPVRGITTLTFNGIGFVNALDGFPEAQKTQVFINGHQVPSAQVSIPGPGHRELTQMAVTVTPDMFPTAGSYELRVRNGSQESRTHFAMGNALPVLNGLSPTMVRVDGTSAVTITLSGTGFDQKSSHLFVGGKVVTTGVSIQTNSMTATLPASLLGSLPGSGTTIGVLTDGPGGGQSAQISLGLVEADAATVSVKPGVTVYDRKSDTYAQQVVLTYGGTRVLNGTVRIGFAGLPAGVSLTNASGQNGGTAYRDVSVNLRSGETTTFTAVFKRTGSAAIVWTPTLSIP